MQKLVGGYRKTDRTEKPNECQKKHFRMKEKLWKRCSTMSYLSVLIRQFKTTNFFLNNFPNFSQTFTHVMKSAFKNVDYIAYGA